MYSTIDFMCWEINKIYFVIVFDKKINQKRRQDIFLLQIFFLRQTLSKVYYYFLLYFLSSPKRKMLKIRDILLIVISIALMIVCGFVLYKFVFEGKF